MTATDERVRQLLEQFEPRTAEDPEWEDVLARLETPVAQAGRRRLRRAAAVLAIGAAAAAAALTITAPWRDGPSILERAGAAIRGPSASEVLSMRFRTRQWGCCRYLGGGDTRLWVEGTVPRHFRALFPGAGAPLDEGGGTLESGSIRSLMRYDRSTNTLEQLSTGSHVSTTNWDPVAIVREAFATGNARVTGRANLGGRPAIRIVLTVRDVRGAPGRAIYYVDPQSYRPLEIDYAHLIELKFPFEPVFGNGLYRIRLRFLDYEYLPATPANRRLADIRAMHPTARMG
jgi:hypothetical protein